MQGRLAWGAQEKHAARLPKLAQGRAFSRPPSCRFEFRWRRQAVFCAKPEGEILRRLAFLLRAGQHVCQLASNLDPRLECAPTGGQVQASILTPCRAW